MSGFQRIQKTIALAVAGALLVTSVPLEIGHAGLLTSEQVINERTQATEREPLATLLQREDVRQQMEALGVDREEALARLAGLSDAEVRQIAGQLDALPAGQALGGVVAVVSVAFIVLFITELVGITKLFPFIEPL